MHNQKKNQSTVSVGFVSLGCAKNLVDSQVMAGVLLQENMALAHSPEEADVVIVNTCAFIEEARQESIDEILYVCRLKEEGKCRAIVVAGCMPQRYRDELQQEIPQIDACIGLDELENVGAIVRRVADGETGVIEVRETAEKLYEPAGPGIVFTGGPYAYLKIAEGCNHRCAFCAIPAIRGAYRSRTIDSIVREAETLLNSGFRELNLISQDIMSYGKDLKTDENLPDLIRALGGIGGQFWIRLLYGYPTGINDKLLAAVAETEQTCHYFDLPIQHSHPDMLRAMTRSETIDAVSGMADRIRAALPDAVLRTTCLVGFPGETEEHFEHLLDFVKATRFDRLGVFAYSPEENTTAFNLKDRPDPELAEERRGILLELQRDIVDEKAAELIGTGSLNLLEQPSTENPNEWISRSQGQAPEVDGVTFVVDVPEKSQPGDFIKVNYTEQNEYDLVATAVKS